MKDKNKFFYYMDNYLKMPIGFQRLTFFGMLFIIAVHIASCFWLILASLVGNQEYDGTWLASFHKIYA